jgi:hypothetical protein
MSADSSALDDGLAGFAGSARGAGLPGNVAGWTETRR